MKNIWVTFLLFSLSTFCFAFNEEIARELHETSSHINGPNCWNGALYVSDVVNSKKFSSPDEWKFILNKYCNEVKSPIYGDIGRIRDVLGVEVHGFIYLNNQSVFAKHGQAKKDGYSFMSFENMLFYYGRTRQCRETNNHDKDCYNKVTYYRCQRKAQLNLHIEQIASLFEELVFSSLTKFRHKDSCLSTSFIQRDLILNEMLTELLALRKIAHFLKKADVLFLKSFVTQLSDIEVSNRIFKCSDRKLKKLNLNPVKKELKALIMLHE